jgi:hypothetical protein
MLVLLLYWLSAVFQETNLAVLLWNAELGNLPENPAVLAGNRVCRYRRRNTGS